MVAMQKFTDITRAIIAACYEVHRVLGPALEERFYREALVHELQIQGFRVRSEQEFAVEYKGKLLGRHRVDLIVEDKVLVELKAVESRLLNVHFAQTVSERQVSHLPAALLVNFGGKSVEVRRFEERGQIAATSKNNPLIP